LAAYGLSLADVFGVQVGLIIWQPIFFGTILLLLGTIAALSGAMLARHSADTGPATRARFSWVSDHYFIHRAQWIGVGLVVTGVFLEATLAVLDHWHSDIEVMDRIHLASMAQGLLLEGVMLAAAMGVYRLILSSHAVNGSNLAGVRDA
jgi:hypothetical protein